MRKTFLNIAITTALSGALFSGSVLSTQAYASEPAPDDIVIADNDNSNNTSSETYLYPGMGVGAASGAIVAGPVGFVVGGVIGALIGSNNEVTEDQEDDADLTLVASSTMQESTQTENIESSAQLSDAEQDDAEKSIQVAQLGPIHSVVEDDINTQQEELMNILVTDLSLDVYFRSGSTDIEKFYPARLSAIADLVNTMDKLELHLDGYTDRRGNKEQNIALANERIEKVREQLIGAGVDENRIVSKAFGEAKMKSSAGNLEAYTFDRRVVIRFERTQESVGKSIAAVFPAITTTTETSSEHVSEENHSEKPLSSIRPVVADATTQF